MQPVKILVKVVALFSCISALMSIKISGSISAGNGTERDLVHQSIFSFYFGAVLEGGQYFYFVSRRN
jgi:hypothetical protein